MKTVFTAILICFIVSCGTSEPETVVTADEQKANSSTDEVPLLPEEKALQDAIKTLKISAAFCYEKKLEEKDSFKLYEIRTYDENGRLSNSKLVNPSNTHTSVTKTFVYNGNGLLKQTNTKTPNQGEINEFFIYNKEGQLSASYKMSNIVAPITDTFQFKRNRDTLLKYKIEGGQPMLDRPDIQVFNKKGQIIKEIQRYPMITPLEVVTKTYKQDFPLPVKEVYSKSLVYPMEYKIEYKFR